MEKLKDCGYEFMTVIFFVGILSFSCILIIKNLFREHKNSDEKVIFSPLLSTGYFLYHCSSSIGEKILFVIASILFYGYGYGSFISIDFESLKTGGFLAALFVIIRAVLLLWIYDFAMFLILWLVVVVTNAAYERKLQLNKKSSTFCHIVLTIIWFPIIGEGISPELVANKSVNQYMILFSWFIMLLIFINQYYYIKELFRRIMKGDEFDSKKAAVQECLLLYVSLILILTELLYLSSCTWENFFKDQTGITMFKCLRYCIMSFTGLGSEELKPEIDIAFVITSCIRLIGFSAIGFLAAEIFSSISTRNRSEQEAYWKTMYDLKSVLCVVGEIRAYLVDKSQIEKIYPNSKEECRLSTEFANIIDKLPEKIDDINYWVKSRRAMDEQLQGLRSLFLDLDDQKAKARSMQIHEIKDTIKNVQNELMELEKKLTQVWEERSF